MNKKFIDVITCEDWLVDTGDGWADIKASGKTIKYDIYEIVLDNDLKLYCADNHILIKSDNTANYLIDLKIGDLIKTKFGDKSVISIKKTNENDFMYDLEIDSKNHTYYINDILSHNSTWLTNLASRSVSLGYNTAYITLELQEELVMMRIGSNLLDLPLDDYENIAQDTDNLRKRLNDFKNKSFKPAGILHVKEFPSSTASSIDIKSYLKKIEEINGIKFDNIFIDYINIMRNWRNPNTENTYMKIKQIAEDLRAMAMEEQWAVITVTQANRSGIDASDLGLTNVSESAALIHTVDLLFAIITNPEMKARSEYYLKCLANRVAGYENTRKRFTMDWKYARIEEDKNSPIEDMDFVMNSVVGGQTQRRGQQYTKSNYNNVNSIKTENINNSGKQVIDISGQGLF